MNDSLKLKIDAHVIRQLGAELITSPIVAITELIKNSHDADANWCQLDIDSDYEEKISVDPKLYPDDKDLIKEGGKTFKVFRGKVTVVDDGHGMTRETINKSWLTVSFSEKRKKKQKGEKTEKDRNYTGDKGLGRLGSMQVASICRISSSTISDNDNIQVTINWDQLIEGITVDQIKIDESSIEKSNVKSKGTKIELIGMSDLSFWTSDLIRFKYEVATHISPFGFFFKRKDAFKFYIKINGVEQDSIELTKSLVELNAGHFEFNFDGEKLTVTGQSSLLSFAPKDKESFQSYVLSNKGQHLYNYFEKSNGLKNFELNILEGHKYFIRWTKSIDFDEMFSDEKYKKRQIENPGEFTSEIYEYRYQSDSMGGGPDGVGFKKSKELIQDYLVGLNLYRDGFKIGSGREDWLDLSREKTSGESYYALRPGNIAGYVDIKWDTNPQLIDTSNREGLVVNSAYIAFEEICKRAVGEINNFKHLSRRLVNDFLNECKNEKHKKPKNYSPEHAISELKDLSQKAENIYKEVQDQKAKTDQKFNSVSISLSKSIKESESIFTEPQHLKILSELKNKVEEVQTLYKQLEPKVLEASTELASSSAMVNVIHEQIESYKNQINRFYGQVSIGLSAQFLAHDVNSQISNIARSNHNIRNRLNFLEVKDVELIKSSMAIDGHTQALSKAVSVLHPLVEAQREEKHVFSIDEGVESYIQYIESYLKNDGAYIFLQKKNVEKISFNHGKFYQILDNMVRNSQYWLNSFGKHHPEIDKEVHIDISGYELTVWDTGKGVRPGTEPSMFDMFVTEKPDGQGLGLFIVRTLLNERKCSIYLLDELNEYGRRYKFRIDFSGAAT